MTVPLLPIERHALTATIRPYPEDTMPPTLADDIRQDIDAAIMDILARYPIREDVNAAVAKILDHYLDPGNLARVVAEALNAPKRPEPAPPPADAEPMP